MSFKSEIWWKLYGEDRDCTFNASFYHHLLLIGVNFIDDTLDTEFTEETLKKMLQHQHKEM